MGLAFWVCGWGLRFGFGIPGSELGFGFRIEGVVWSLGNGVWGWDILSLGSWFYESGFLVHVVGSRVQD